MPKPRPLYVQKHVTRHGKIVWYFRIGTGPRTRMPGQYGDKEFMEAHRRLLAGETIAPKRPAGKMTLQWLVDQYQESAAFKQLSPATQSVRRNMYKNVCKGDAGSALLSQIGRATIAGGRDKRADTPFAAISFMKMMSYLFEWGVDAGYMDENPCKGVKRPKVKTDGHKPWSEEDIIAFYRKHPAGSQARLAMELLMFTGLRRSDVYRIGPQHIRGDVIEYRATKNGEDLYIALHPILKASLAAVKTGHMAYLVTPIHGRPFKSAASFGNWFGEMCREAGVSVRAHGIRKSVAQKLAELGGSNSELKALFGWNSDAMASLYTRKADRRRMALSAAEKLNENILSPHLETGVGENQKND
ncbi:tyrosine-type recombinase/integrase [Rhizobium alvei]|uniref:Tyrosine-type recombinase/integrase n=1 Tax=Rhizobium alvei TaxID=1132659 RepID=A0ABT8YQ13_9HYPH|nr:tyrosine-type recombinase/integrase [Rhizobium alvei]MDO6965818.1 tyrosine-type recombinase/integrase [Rhizobium alvei]